jgi:hypothetical protein
MEWVTNDWDGILGFIFFLGTGKGVSEKWLVGVLAIRNYQCCASSYNESRRSLAGSYYK